MRLQGEKSISSHFLSHRQGRRILWQNSQRVRPASVSPGAFLLAGSLL